MSHSIAALSVRQAPAVITEQNDPLQVQILSGGRINQDVVKEYARRVLAEIGMGELRLANGSVRPHRRLRRWLEDEFLDMTQFDFGEDSVTRKQFLQAIVSVVTKKNDPYVNVTRAHNGDIIIHLTTHGQDFLRQKAFDAHPSTASIRINQKDTNK